MSIRRFDRLGTIFQKKQFHGLIDGDAGHESIMAAMMYPGYIVPEYQWLRFRILGDSSSSTDMRATAMLRLSERYVNLPESISDASVNDIAELEALQEQYMKIDPSQQSQDNVDAVNVGITGGEEVFNKDSEIYSYECHLGLPNHGLMVGANKIMYHAISKKTGFINAPRSVDLTMPQMIGFNATYNSAVTAGTTLEDSLTGDFGDTTSTNSSLEFLYEQIVASIPRPVGDNADLRVTGDGENSNLFDWMNRGFENGTYPVTESDAEQSLAYVVDWTIRCGIYAPKNSNMLVGP